MFHVPSSASTPSPGTDTPESSPLFRMRGPETVSLTNPPEWSAPAAPSVVQPPSRIAYPAEYKRPGSNLGLFCQFAFQSTDRRENQAVEVSEPESFQFVEDRLRYR